MEEQNSSDHLNSSLTDLMTSLMVIFILLMLVFVHRTASKDAVITDLLLKKLRQDMIPQGFNDKTIRPDPRDRNAILVIVPDRLMNFESGRATLGAEGRRFLKSYIPEFAEVLCNKEFRASVESIVVEGHTDAYPWVGRSTEESQNFNLKLSQERSMEVVTSALKYLTGSEENRACFLEKLSATGRGEQEQEATPEESRRVILKIRVKAADLQNVKAGVP